MEDGACGCGLSILGRGGCLREVRRDTILELDGDRFVGALHEESRGEREALAGAIEKRAFGREEDSACDRCRRSAGYMYIY